MPPIPDDNNESSLIEGSSDDRVFMKIQPVLFDHSTNISNSSMISVDNKLSNDEEKYAEKMMTPSFKTDLFTSNDKVRQRAIEMSRDRR